jgi:hypothetical protein
MLLTYEHAGASCRVGIRPGKRSQLPGRRTRRVPFWPSRFRPGFQRPRGDQGGGGGHPRVEVAPAFDVELEGGERAGGELLPKPSQCRPARGQRKRQVLAPRVVGDHYGRRHPGRHLSEPVQELCCSGPGRAPRSIRISRASPSAAGWPPASRGSAATRSTTPPSAEPPRLPGGPPGLRRLAGPAAPGAGRHREGWAGPSWTWHGGATRGASQWGQCSGRAGAEELRYGAERADP